MKKVFFIFTVMLFIFPNFASAEKARAYLVDGNNGTRSGPIRDAKDVKQLEQDRKTLLEHARSDFRSSGIAKEKDTYWTNLPQDSIFVVLERQKLREQAERERIQRQQAEREQAQREQVAREQEAARQQRSAELQERMRREREHYQRQGGNHRTPW